MPLLPPFGSSELVVWRLDQAIYGTTWDSGEGSFRAGGRWNSRGVRAVYCSMDPATAILEVAVHKGFKALDTIEHVLTAATIIIPTDVFIPDPVAVPNPNWLKPGLPSAGQQEFGDELLGKYKFVAFPSVISNHSWNVVFIAGAAAGAYSLKLQEKFALDTRLHPSTAP